LTKKLRLKTTYQVNHYKDFTIYMAII